MSEEEKKELQRQYRSKRYQANKEKVSAQGKAYRQANKEKVSAQQKAYRQANKEKISACYQANKEKISAQQKAYRQANKEKISACYQANKEKISAQRKAYRQANKEKISAQRKAYRQANKEKVAKQKTISYFKNKEKIKETKKIYVQKNKEKVRLQQRNWKNKNRKKVNEYAVNFYHDKIQNDTQFKIKHNIRALIFGKFKNKSVKSKTTTELLGCSFEQFKLHLESQFESWMNWDNGPKKYDPNGPKVWQIDHIIPVSNFDLIDSEQIKKAFHYTNCRPYDAFVNISEGNRRK
jgi:hypothetical protein